MAPSSDIAPSSANTARITTILSSLLIFLLAVLLTEIDSPRVEDLRGTGDVTGTAHGMTALAPPDAEIYMVRKETL
jgi:hypothetical protein